MSKHKPALPERLYYRLADAAQIVGCSRDDLLHYGARGYLEVITRSPYCWARGNEFDYDEGLPFFTTQPYVGFHFCALFPRVLCEIEVNGVALYDSARDLYKFVNGRLSRGMSENGFVHFPAEVATRNPESAFYWIISKERVDVAMPLDQRGFHDIEVRMDDLWVRAEELRRFQIDGSSHVQSDPPMSDIQEKPIGPTERNKMLAIMAALCKEAGIDIKARGAAVEIARLTSLIGADVSDDTVGRRLKEIPEALASLIRE